MTAPRCRFHVGIDMVEIGASVAIADFDAPTMVNWRCPVSRCPHVAQSCRSIEHERMCARCGKRAQTSYVNDRYCYECLRYFNKEYSEGRTPVRVLGHQLRQKRRKLGSAATVFVGTARPGDIRLSQ